MKKVFPLDVCKRLENVFLLARMLPTAFIIRGIMACGRHKFVRYPLVPLLEYSIIEAKELLFDCYFPRTFCDEMLLVLLHNYRHKYLSM